MSDGIERLPALLAGPPSADVWMGIARRTGRLLAAGLMFHSRQVSGLHKTAQGAKGDEDGRDADPPIREQHREQNGSSPLMK